MLTEKEIQKANELKNQGYSLEEVQAYIGAERAGLSSSIHDEIRGRIESQNQIQANAARWQDIVAAPANFLAGDAVDVFGTALARRGIGTDTDAETVQEFYDEPTKRQYAGAALETLALAADVGVTVGSLGAATPWTVGRNVAYGAASGYVYDVADDLIAQESLVETLTPGMGTLIGTAAPLAFAGIGVGARQLRPAQEAGEAVADDLGRAVAKPIREATTDVVEEAVDTTAGKAAKSLQEVGRDLGGRATRYGRRVAEKIDDNAARAEMRVNAEPAVVNAIDEGLDTNLIARVTTANDVTKDGYRAVMQAAAGTDPRQAEIVAGDYVAEMYNIAKAEKSRIGSELGAARKSLGTDIIDPEIYNPSMRTLGDTFQRNGVILKPDGSVEFLSSKFIPEEEKVISDIWSRLAKYDTISPQEVDEVLQYFSKLRYKSNAVDKIGNIYIDVIDPKTGQTFPRPIFTHLQDTYDDMLAKMDTTGNIANLRSQYSQVKGLTDNIEGTWFNGMDINKSTDAEIADAASLALRRLDSRAKSRVTYGQMYNALYDYAQRNGYKGADAKEISNFYLTAVEPLYKETTPPASATGLIGGIRNMIGEVLNVGQPNATDKQKALRGLLNLEDIKAPTVNPAATDFNPSATTKTTDLLEEVPKIEITYKGTFEDFERLPLKGDLAKIQESTIKQYVDDPVSLSKKYLSNEKNYLTTNDGSKILVANTDEARKLFPEYDPQSPMGVHEASSRVAKDILATGLKNDGKYATAFAGGAGSGKTSVIKSELGKKVSDTAVILDGTLAKIKSADNFIEQAEKAGKIPEIAYAYRDPYESFMEGMIKRALTNPEEGGRVVPISAFIQGHEGSLSTVKNLMNIEKYPNIEIDLIDNSRGLGKQRLVGSLDDIDNIVYTIDRSRLVDMVRDTAKQIKLYGKRLTDKQIKAILEE